MSRAYWIYPAYGASSNERAAGTLDVGQDTLQAPNQPANQTEDPSAPNLSELSGQAAKSIWGVMMRSAPHRHLFVGDLEWLLMPPHRLQTVPFVAAGEYAGRLRQLGPAVG
jgi:hypothetical protein